MVASLHVVPMILAFYVAPSNTKYSKCVQLVRTRLRQARQQGCKI